MRVCGVRLFNYFSLEELTDGAPPQVYDDRDFEGAGPSVEGGKGEGEVGADEEFVTFLRDGGLSRRFLTWWTTLMLRWS